MRVIDSYEALEGLRAAVATKGRDHTHGAAAFFDGEGKPSCLVGQALFEMGIQLPAWAGGWMNNLENIWLKPLNTTLAPRARELFQYLFWTVSPDFGKTWGQCLDEIEAWFWNRVAEAVYDGVAGLAETIHQHEVEIAEVLG